MCSSDLAAVAPRPILKWPGGKAQLKEPILRAIDRLHPRPIEVYHEPFVGGGAIFFALAAKRRFRHAVISDTNAELIGLYVAIRDDVEGVIRALTKLTQEPYGEETYYALRAAKPRSPCAQAARMIYLNKTCYNGLYRVNKSGGFNVPWGKRKNPQILDVEGLRAASAALAGVEIRVRSFGLTASLIHTDDDFVYYDPPYVPVTKTSFQDYQAAGFSADLHQALANQMRALATYGASALLSNSDCPATRALYQGLKKKRVITRHNINRNGAERGGVSELLVESRFTAARRKGK